VEAVTQAARVIRAFRQYGASEADLLSVARRVDEYVTPFWDWEFYATAVLIEITDAHTVTVVSAGHPAPLHVSAAGIVELPVHACVPLGLGPAEQGTTHSWSADDRLLLYTDGLVEARDRTGTFLPRSEIDVALRLSDPDECLEHLLHSVYTHAGQFTDDLALLLMTHAPSSNGGPPVG
jgi:serine phosphatase RsbU (regulator of sigma subunit)